MLQQEVKNFKIKKLSEIKHENLIEFYTKVFRERDKRLINNFQWCYRNGYNNLEPIVIEIENKIAGHAGLIPVDLKINEKINQAIWFTDFIILPEFRGKGFGEILTKEWMKLCPFQITFCNKTSLRIFKKLGWKENLDLERIIIPINHLKFIPIIKRFNLKNINKNFIEVIDSAFLNMSIDYIDILNSRTLIRPRSNKENFKIFIAFYLNKTRLIDNI